MLRGLIHYDSRMAGIQRKRLQDGGRDCREHGSSCLRTR